MSFYNVRKTVDAYEISQAVVEADSPAEAARKARENEGDYEWEHHVNREVLIQIMEEAVKPDPNENHVYCQICRECITCNLRPCHNGRTHIPEQA